MKKIVLVAIFSLAAWPGKAVMAQGAMAHVYTPAERAVARQVHSKYRPTYDTLTLRARNYLHMAEKAKQSKDTVAMSAYMDSIGQVRHRARVVRDSERVEVVRLLTP